VGPSREQYEAPSFRVPETPDKAVGFQQAFLALRHFARRPGRQIEGFPSGPPSVRLMAASVVGQADVARLAGLPTATGVPAGFGPILVAVAQRDRDPAELATDGLASGPKFLGDRSWAHLRPR
jgi:hypothetical protein